MESGDGGEASPNTGLRRAVPWILLVVLAVLAGIGAVLGVNGFGASTLRVQPVTPALAQPLLVGLSLDRALAVARDDDMRVVVLKYPARSPRGTVIEQLSYRPTFLVVSSGPPRNLHAALPGADGPPVSIECVSRFELDADGNAGPATCGGGHVNVAVWDYFARSDPPMLGLGRTASACEVVGDYDPQLSVAMNYTVYELAAAYYGWPFRPLVGRSLVTSGAKGHGCAS
jgi:hypothetical protein